MFGSSTGFSGRSRVLVLGLLLRTSVTVVASPLILWRFLLFVEHLCGMGYKTERFRYLLIASGSSGLASGIVLCYVSTVVL